MIITVISCCRSVTVHLYRWS